MIFERLLQLQLLQLLQMGSKLMIFGHLLQLQLLLLLQLINKRAGWYWPTNQP